jgi:hypothetical protein
MAKIQYGPIVSDASGKSAGTVFSRWRTRSYVRRHVKPGNPKTAAQQLIRNAFKLQTKRFLRFGADLLTAWTSYAAGKAVTNRSAFIGKTVQNERLLQAWPFTPGDPAVFPAYGLVLTPAATQITAVWQEEAVPVTGKAMVILYDRTAGALVMTLFDIVFGVKTKVCTGLLSGHIYEVGVVIRNDGVTPKKYSISVEALATVP